MRLKLLIIVIVLAFVHLKSHAQFRISSSFKGDDVVQNVPMLMDLALEPLGAEAKHPFLDRTLELGVAIVTEAALVNTIKYTVREMRPDGSARNSFPSGHTSTAFTGAELVRMEYGWGYGSAAYLMGVGVAYCRVGKGRHWWWDCVAGAGIGVFSAHVGEWLLPYTRSAWDRMFPGTAAPKMSFSPSYDPMTGAVGTSLAFTF